MCVYMWRLREGVVRHLCVLHVCFSCLEHFLLLVYKMCNVGLVPGELPLFETSLCTQIPRYTHVCFFLVGWLYAPWAQLKRVAIRPHYCYYGHFHHNIFTILFSPSKTIYLLNSSVLTSVWSIKSDDREIACTLWLICFRSLLVVKY